MLGPVILFGASSLGEGEFRDGKDHELLQWLHDNGVSRFDTAALYPLSSPGASEEALGRFQRASGGKTTVDTKILLTDFSGKGSLAPDAINRSVSLSTSRLPTGINVLYCHIADPKTPVDVTVKALNQQYNQGHFKQLGLSNFSFEQVAAFVRVCEENQCVKPSVYEGQYNALCRASAKSLMPLLREKGLSFVAYSPLAGGFLTGNFTNGRGVAGTRFDDAHPGAAMYKAQYDRPELHDAVRKLEAGCRKNNVTLGEAALRWLYHHSDLKEGDGIILGASKTHQVQQNLNDIRKGPLPESLVELFGAVGAGV